MAKIQTSQEIADRIHSLSTQLAALQFQYDQAVAAESAIAVGNCVQFYNGRRDPEGNRSILQGTIAGLGIGGNQNRLAKIRVGSGFDEALYTVRVSDIIRLPAPASEELTAEQDAAA